MISGGYTATGPRDANEDNFYQRDFDEFRTTAGNIASFIMVSDGMGGYQCGDVASALAVASANRYIEQLFEMSRGNIIELDPIAALFEIARNAHDAIVAESASRGGIGMGATMVAAFVSPTHAWIAHVGDSRAYLIRTGNARQLTEDHSKVGRLLSAGVITEEEARNHPDRNRIERALGFGDATPEADEIDLQKGDVLLLCSDGVYTALDSSWLNECVSKAPDAVSASKNVVQQAIDRGTDDNSTAVVLMEERKNIDLSRKKAKVKQNPYEKGSSQEAPKHVIVIIVLLAGVFVGVLAALFIGQLDMSRQENASPAQSGVVGTTESVDEPSDGSDDARERQFVTEQIPTNAGIVLKYVDQEGLAQRFTYPPLSFDTEVQLVEGAYLTLSLDSDSFGRDGKRYRVLSDNYLKDLKSDVSQCQSGEELFDSALSQICDRDQYASFITTLANINDTAFLESITNLIVDSFDYAAEEPDEVSLMGDEPILVGNESAIDTQAETLDRQREFVLLGGVGNGR